MPSLVRQFLQERLRASRRAPDCPRAVCRRFRRCVPPPEREQDGLPFCPFMTWQESRQWEERLPDMLQPVEDLLRRHTGIRKLWESGQLDALAAGDRRPASRRARRRLPWYLR